MSTHELTGINSYDPLLLKSHYENKEVKETSDQKESKPFQKHEKGSPHWDRIQNMFEIVYSFSNYEKTNHLRLNEARTNRGGGNLSRNLLDMLEVGEDTASKRQEAFENVKKFSQHEEMVFKGILEIYCYKTFKNKKVKDYLEGHTDASIFFDNDFAFDYFYNSILQHQILDILSYNSGQGQSKMSLQNIIDCFPETIPKQLITKALEEMMGYTLEYDQKWIIHENGFFMIKIKIEEESLPQLIPYLLEKINLYSIQMEQRHNNGPCIIC
ncbi:MAG: hypothetical protein AB7N99_04085 [Simkaniaceae bacterium]